MVSGIVFSVVSVWGGVVSGILSVGGSSGEEMTAEVTAMEAMLDLVIPNESIISRGIVAQTAPTISLIALLQSGLAFNKDRCRAPFY